MINTPQQSGQLPYKANSQPLRRPGWGLIQDVYPPQTRHRVAPTQPDEVRYRPITPKIPNNIPPAIHTKTISRKQLLVYWLQKNSLFIATPLIIIASIRVSTLPMVGAGIIIAYGLIAVIRQVPSHISFWLATTILTSIGIEFLLLPEVERANNSALFVLLLLCIGLISSILETRRTIKAQ